MLPMLLIGTPPPRQQFVAFLVLSYAHIVTHRVAWHDHSPCSPHSIHSPSHSAFIPLPAQLLTRLCIHAGTTTDSPMHTRTGRCVRNDGISCYCQRCELCPIQTAFHVQMHTRTYTQATHVFNLRRGFLRGRHQGIVRVLTLVEWYIHIDGCFWQLNVFQQIYKGWNSRGLYDLIWILLYSNLHTYLFHTYIC